MTLADIRPFTIDIPQPDLDDLRARLDRTRWAAPAAEEYGFPVSRLRRLAGYWRDAYDWRAWEARLNSYPQFVTEIDGQRIHFLHVHSAEPGALPLVLTHGWPGSVVEYLDLIGPLTDPRGHGADPAQAFDVVIPSLPGFGFSSPTREAGWDTQHTAHAWAELMSRLGYDIYGAVGNDVGSMISPVIGRLAPDRVAGVHVTQLFCFPSGAPGEMDNLTPDEQAALGVLSWFLENKGAFNTLHSQQPRPSRTLSATPPPGCLPGTASCSTTRSTTTSSSPTSRCTGSPTQQARPSASTTRTHTRNSRQSRRQSRSGWPPQPTATSNRSAASPTATIPTSCPGVSCPT
jgi:epoxide hydrolase